MTAPDFLPNAEGIGADVGPELGPEKAMLTGLDLVEVRVHEVLARAYGEFTASDKAADLFDWQSEALRNAGLLVNPDARSPRPETAQDDEARTPQFVETGGTGHRLPPAVDPDGRAVDHDCDFRRMLREVAQMLDVRQDDGGRYDMNVAAARLETLLAASRSPREESADSLAEAAIWTSRLWRDWPQERRNAVRALSAHLADAMESQAELVWERLIATSTTTTSEETR